MPSSKPRYSPVEYWRLANAALPLLPQLLPRWLPDGRRIGAEWVARNPTRDDSTLGSFKFNLRTGRWADFATGDKGGDAISLIAYIRGISQYEAAQILADDLETQS
ncbi:hypothetical protein ILT44_23810 [Microvirga sp. BT689]|uniref:hypothetical protein n=1 Tax=Microvirga arvi TaxID=2778731 RepID=UPI0019509175|nr:hypothetical protein [Microvirga arvi]MBM6583232.1 hypothetical protein [Microvirga arvi]